MVRKAAEFVVLLEDFAPGTVSDDKRIAPDPLAAGAAAGGIVFAGAVTADCMGASDAVAAESLAGLRDPSQGY